MSSSLQQVFPIIHSSDIAAARRAGVQLAGRVGLPETIIGKLAIVITEAGTNILKHASAGKILLRSVRAGAIDGIEVLAVDKGPGIANLAQSLRDGVSSVGTAGNGLGAMRRLSDQFDVYTLPGNGCALRMGLWAAPDTPHDHGLQLGAICVPMAGEEACGDAWGAKAAPHGMTLLVADGLGHGPEAARAAQAAVQILDCHGALPPARLIEAAHAALRATRGAALAAVHLPHGSEGAETLLFAGIGNISAGLVTGDAFKQLMSHNGIVGHNIRKVQEFALSWDREGIFIAHSDGLSKQWNLASYPGLTSCHPSLIAAVLYRDFTRERDDVVVVVVKRERGGH